MTLLLSCTPALKGQSNTAPPIKGMASTVGLYVYPRAQQSPTQQLSDEGQCYSNAKTQTGFDPNATAPAASHSSTSSGNKEGNGSTGKDAARGAVVAGAAGGDPAVGARRGALIGAARRKREEKEQSEKSEKQTNASKTQEEQSMDGFKRSMSACLDARGYSVK
ncbi:hypothetical protein ACPOL_1941 [Acidisarcina polymorpha]|uniref:Uncharacterized protein n=1 Tax=Acidisarcina polymorpha TaxID=2211140 RepID=A0A2Z5FXS8_9BACT|nr:hypothetical protein [Acidisarcina polymorpha]AXC11277.1 hypothetical protein ACPOL_1941 [Acidisarcina polymorpha]